MSSAVYLPFHGRKPRLLFNWRVGGEGRRGISGNCKSVFSYTSLSYLNSIRFQQGVNQNNKVRRWQNAVSLWLKSTKPVSYDAEINVIATIFPDIISWHCELSLNMGNCFLTGDVIFVWHQQWLPRHRSGGHRETGKQTWQINTLNCICIKLCHRNTLELDRCLPKWETIKYILWCFRKPLIFQLQ